MRKIIAVFIVVIVTVHCSAQQASPQLSIKDSFIEKSKNQKKVAFIMLGAGAALVGTALIIPRGDFEGTEIDGLGGVTEKYSNDGVKAACGLTGVLSMLGSIPLFLASSRNKKRAMSISFKNEFAPQLYNNNYVYIPVPSVTLKLGL